MLSRSSPPSSIRARLACSTFWRRSVAFRMAGNFLPAPLDTVKSLLNYRQCQVTLLRRAGPDPRGRPTHRATQGKLSSDREKFSCDLHNASEYFTCNMKVG